MATARIRYVNPDSAGGDGTTQNLSGSTAAYASLQACLNAERADLVAADVYLEVICESNGTADSTAVNQDVAGWTTDATRYVHIKPGVGHRASTKWNASKYRLEASPTSQFTFVALAGSVGGILYCRFEGIQVSASISNLEAQTRAIGLVNFSPYAPTGADMRVFGCHLRITGSQPTYAFQNNFYGAFGAPSYIGGTPKPSFYIYNNVISFEATALSFPTTNSGVRFEHRDHNAYIYNNTILNWSCGIGGDNNSNRLHYCKNNLISGATNLAFNGSYQSSRCGYNSTTLSSMGYTSGTGDRVSQTFTFAASDDYAITGSDSGARDFGLTDPGSGLFSDDINGVTRSGSWDIGAYEFTSSGLTMVRQCANGQFQALEFVEISSLYPAMRIGANVQVQVHEMIEESGRTTHQINTDGIYRCGEFIEK